MSDSNDELMMETMYWWGIPTLFRCEHNKNLSECDIALAGVPIALAMALLKEISI
jgi:guanidinopropionase